MSELSKEKGKELLVLLAITVVAAIPSAILAYIVDYEIIGSFLICTAMISMIVYLIKEDKIKTILTAVLGIFCTLSTFAKILLIVPGLGIVLWLMVCLVIILILAYFCLVIMMGASIGYWGLLIFNVIEFGLTFVGINIPTKVEKVVNILCLLGGAIFLVVMMFAS